MKNTAANLWLASIGDAEALRLKLVTAVKDAATAAENSMTPYRATRAKTEACMRNEFGWRETVAEDDIFHKSNETMGLVRSGIAFIVARTQEDILGSTPWFAASPVGKADSAIAEKIQKHASHKLHEAGFETIGEQAIERVFNFGEAILCTGWTRQVVKYHRLATVLCQGPAGNERAVPAPDGGVIEEGEIEAVEAQDSGAGSQEPAAGAPAPALTVRGQPFQFDPATQRFCEVLVEEQEERFNGLLPYHVDWKDFRCAVNVPCVADAPFRGHYCQMRLSEIVQFLEAWHEVPMKDFDAGTLETLARLKAEGAGNNIESRKANAPAGDEKNPTIECLKFEIEFDALENGDTRMLTGTLFTTCEQFLFVEFLAVVAPGRNSLYTVPAAYKLPNTWAGRGWWELYEDLTRNADKIWNNLIFRAGMQCNPITGIMPEAFDEDVETKKLLPGARLRLKEGKTLKDGLDFALMPSNDGPEWELLQFFMKLNQLETGVTSSAQGGLGDLPATNTATGIQSVLASGSTLHKRPAKEIKQGFEVFLETSLAVLYSQHDKDETFTFGEGENLELVQLTRQDVLDLKLNVRLEMTRFKQRELVDNARAAIQALMQYLALPEAEKPAARPMFIQVLKGLDIQNPEQAIRQAVEQPAPNPMEQIKVNFGDLPREAKAQMLARLGFEGITPEMMEGDADEDESAKPPGAGEKKGGRP